MVVEATISITTQIQTQILQMNQIMTYSVITIGITTFNDSSGSNNRIYIKIKTKTITIITIVSICECFQFYLLLMTMVQGFRYMNSFLILINEKCLLYLIIISHTNISVYSNAPFLCFEWCGVSFNFFVIASLHDVFCRCVVVVFFNDCFFFVFFF